MVWVSSSLFGCGKARSRTGKVIVVAHYYPRGNVVGRFHKNVFPMRDPDVQDLEEAAEKKEEAEIKISRTASIMKRFSFRKH